jgi:hypothetical protein
MSTPTPVDTGALRPWYLNGTLAGRERDEVEIWLGSSEQAQSELLLWRAVQIDARSRPMTEGGADLGWRRLHARLPAAPAAVVREPPRRPWRWAAAASVLVVIALQSALLLRGPDDPLHRPLTVPAQADRWQLQVRFADDMPVAELSDLLARYEATVSDGPSALGIYTIAIPRAAAPSPDALAERLRTEPRVLQVTVAP